uniref:Uncharacterized protein n=1 Tax=Anopheles atroparvus TaxID=41427 RepID=A0AAG5DY28_ANOAO
VVPNWNCGVRVSAITPPFPCTFARGKDQKLHGGSREEITKFARVCNLDRSYSRRCAVAERTAVKLCSYTLKGHVNQQAQC